jgi:hypothetical protein
MLVTMNSKFQQSFPDSIVYLWTSSSELYLWLQFRAGWDLDGAQHNWDFKGILSTNAYACPQSEAV